MLTISDHSTPVVVLKSDSHGGLNIMRSLGRLGVPIYNVDPNPLAPAFFSRFCKKKFRWDFDAHTSQESVEYLLNVVRREAGRPCLIIPTTDRTALFLSDHARQLNEAFLFPQQPSGLPRALSSKKEMFFLARRHGIPTPDAAFPQCRRDVECFLQHARFPVMLKGIDGQRLWERTGKKMFIVRTPAELLEMYDAIEDFENPNLMLQEYIPGGDDTIWMFNGYFDRNSECLAAFTGKKIRQCPVHTGSTSLGICLENAAVEAVTKKFMKAVGYRGILDIGYRYDARDRQYKVLDVNPRIGATFRLFTDQNGMDVARALYLDLTGQPVAALPVVQGRRWVVEDLDTVSSFRYIWAGELTLKDWFTSFRGVQEAAFLTRDDPFPVFPMLIGRTRELFRRICGFSSRAKQRSRPSVHLGSEGGNYAQTESTGDENNRRAFGPAARPELFESSRR